MVVALVILVHSIDYDEKKCPLDTSAVAAVVVEMTRLDVPQSWLKQALA